MLHYFNKLTNPVFSPFSTSLPTLTFAYSAIIIDDSFIMFIVEVMLTTDRSGHRLLRARSETKALIGLLATSCINIEILM